MIEKIFKFLYVLIILVFIFSIFQKNNLPKKESIDKNLYKEPIQTETMREQFSFGYRGKSYDVLPVADYELWGLVVSVNNINAWYNYYHDENTVNLKDVCVVWGENISNEPYLEPKTKIKNGEWTCYVEWWDEKGKIKMNELSNNHLLTANERMQEIIRNVHIGDQIYIRGSLVDYSESGTTWYRKTSISRNDSNQNSRSGGACEIVYVDEIKIISQNQAFWNLLNKWSLKILIVLIFINFIIYNLALIKREKNFKKEFKEI